MDDNRLDYGEPMDEDNHHTIDDSNNPSFDSIANRLLDGESDVTDDNIELIVPQFTCVCVDKGVQQQLAHCPNVRPSHGVINSKFKTKKEGNRYCYKPRPP